MNDSVLKTVDGAIVYDTTLINQISPQLFTPAGWASTKPVQGVLRSAGRGNALIVSDGEREFVLRHYLRGGLPGRMIRDSYFWMGADSTRSFAEWYFLARLQQLELPAPRPAAARFVRTGLLYRADLLTLRIPGIRSLAGGVFVAGTHRTGWDGKDNGGRDQASGVYLCRLSSGGMARNVKLVLAREGEFATGVGDRLPHP